MTQVTPPRPLRVRTDSLPVRPELAQQSAAPARLPPPAPAPSPAPPTSTATAAPSPPAPARASRKKASSPNPREAPRAATSENTVLAQKPAPPALALDIYAYVGFLLEREDPARFDALLQSGQETVDFLDVLRRSR